MASNVSLDVLAVATTAGELLGTKTPLSEVKLLPELLPRLYNLVNTCEYCGFWERAEDLHDLGGERICDFCLEMEVHQD